MNHNTHIDAEIITLSVSLAHEMLRERLSPDALPTGASAVADIARRLQTMVAVTPEGEHFRALAEIYLDV